MDSPLCIGLYAVLILVSKFWLKQIFFDKKDFDCNNNPIYPTFFCFLLQFFFLATIKIEEQQALITIIYIYLRLQTFLSILTISSSRYSLYKFPGKMENSNFLTQICLKIDLSLGFQKTNLRIRTNILEI